jgi:hypothetical protein
MDAITSVEWANSDALCLVSASLDRAIRVWMCTVVSTPSSTGGPPTETEDAYLPWRCMRTINRPASIVFASFMPSNPRLVLAVDVFDAADVAHVSSSSSGGGGHAHDSPAKHVTRALGGALALTKKLLHTDEIFGYAGKRSTVTVVDASSEKVVSVAKVRVATTLSHAMHRYCDAIVVTLLSTHAGSVCVCARVFLFRGITSFGAGAAGVMVSCPRMPRQSCGPLAAQCCTSRTPRAASTPSSWRRTRASNR